MLTFWKEEAGEPHLVPEFLDSLLSTVLQQERWP